ncbi:uncharacterized protein C8R40DRAFT_1135752 [Lentinula edodes]|uniref:uncharacterized protein n=1 Tax=Lentinula edodes TaxID=5353 RepID=UPI001E8CA444|nr:uncharacterized protein C8R40DRAFT_1135752 [Lentinula edodes]KAH7868222.1 hypothetical protein C8R40DRAFT_1135752 [Lentinula edodes]
MSYIHSSSLLCCHFFLDAALIYKNLKPTFVVGVEKDEVVLQGPPRRQFMVRAL